MSKTQPIRETRQLTELKEYYLTIHPNLRNYTLITLGLNTALRIGDILKITWGMVYDFDRNQYRSHLLLTEQKTHKETMIALNHTAIAALDAFRQSRQPACENLYLFSGQKNKSAPISRQQAYRIIKEAADHAHLTEHISCHSLRKTFGYHAWKNGTPPALLMAIFNHSSYQITKRYLCIDQEDKDHVFCQLNL